MGCAVKISYMAKFGDILRAIRTLRGLSQAELAKLADISVQRISDYEQMEAPNMYNSTQKRLAEALGLNVPQLQEAYLYGVPDYGKEPRPQTLPPDIIAAVRNIEKSPPSAAWLLSQKPPLNAAELPDIPVYDALPASAATFHSGDEALVKKRLPRGLWPRDPAAYATVVKGDSMAPWVNDGDIVVLSPSLRSQVEDGDICCIRMATSKEEGCTLKQVFTHDEDRLKLVPLNSGHPARLINKADVASIDPVVIRIANDFLRRKWDYPNALHNEQLKPIGPEQPHPDYDGLQ